LCEQPVVGKNICESQCDTHVAEQTSIVFKNSAKKASHLMAGAQLQQQHVKQHAARPERTSQDLHQQF
jgi:hypothetical protein